MWYKNFGLGSRLPKTTLEPNLTGGWAREHCKNSVSPYLFLQPLTLMTSRLLYDLGCGCSWSKTTFRANPGGLVTGVVPIWDFTSAAIEANKSKLGTQLGFGEKLIEATTKTQIVGVLCKTPQFSGPLRWRGNDTIDIVYLMCSQILTGS